jgi:hypothetical protein
MMKKILLILLAAFSIGFFAVPAHADVYVKSKMMNDMNINEAWTSGKKQRMSTNSAAMSGMGENVSIIRADKGVEWHMNTLLKVYQERPLALPYTPGTKVPDPNAKPVKAGFSGQDIACEKIRKISKQRSFAGIKARGYVSDCSVNGPKLTIWIAENNQKTAKAAFEESQRFQKAQSEALFADYPAAERKKMMEHVEKYGAAMSGDLMGLPNPAKLPKNLAVGMELVDDKGSQMIMEVQEISIVPADNSRYEVPADYKKVDNLALLQSKQMVDFFAKDLAVKKQKAEPAQKPKAS